MSAKAILGEMIALTRLQVERVIHGEHQALLDGANQQEAMLTALQTAEIDGTPEELRALYEELDLERAKLVSLVESESVRVDFMLRLMMGSPDQKQVGYPKRIQNRSGGSRLLNQKT